MTIINYNDDNKITIITILDKMMIIIITIIIIIIIIISKMKKQNLSVQPHPICIV